MERNVTDEKGQAVLSYLERNGAWIKAVIGCLILATAPGIMQVFDPGLSGAASALGWLTVVGLVLGFFCLGYGLVQAGTMSARIVLIVLMGLAVAAAVEAFLMWWGGMQ